GGAAWIVSPSPSQWGGGWGVGPPGPLLDTHPVGDEPELVHLLAGPLQVLAGLHQPAVAGRLATQLHQHRAITIRGSDRRRAGRAVCLQHVPLDPLVLAAAGVGMLVTPALVGREPDRVVLVARVDARRARRGRDAERGCRHERLRGP